MSNHITKYDKLVRDKIPEIIESRSSKAHTKQLSRAERRLALNQKLLEEIKELQSTDCREYILEEAADIYEVLIAILSDEGYVDKDLVDAARRKRESKGGFSKGVWLESIEDYKCSL